MLGVGGRPSPDMLRALGSLQSLLSTTVVVTPNQKQTECQDFRKGHGQVTCAKALGHEDLLRSS